VMMYVVDNNGYFPGPAAGATKQYNDWLYFQTGRDLQRSRIALYLGTPLPESILRCPSDDWESHQQVDGNGGPYHYSYSINTYLTMRGDNSTPMLPKVTRLDTVNHPEDKVLFAEESETTINDGMWAPVPDPAFSGIDWLASRHETRRELTDAEKDATTGRRGRANVSFADGHVDFVPRSYAHDEAHVLMLR
jgi:prepilin-type processing-associated H-X9-DG protein